MLVTGEGTVTSNPAGIAACASDCNATFGTNTDVALTASRGPTAQFDGWEGSCTGTSPNVTVRMDSSKTCTARFSPDPNAFALDLEVTGQGTVTSTPAGIDCGGDCSEVYALNTMVTLMATPAALSRFEVWGGACAGTTPSVTVVMNANQHCTARFLPAPNAFTLDVQVTGQGTVTSTPPGIDCGGDCSELYSLNTAVTLDAAPEAGWRIEAWSGDCGGTTASVVVTMNANKSCTARFGSLAGTGWQTLAQDIGASLESDVISSVALDSSGRAYVALLQTVRFGQPPETEYRLGVKWEGTGTSFAAAPLGGILSSQAHTPTLLIGPTDAPIVVFNVDATDNAVARWDGVTWLSLGVTGQRMNLTASDASRPRMARAGNTLVFAWLEGGIGTRQIAVRRHHLDTGEWDVGAFVPGVTGLLFDIDLALDSSGLAVIAYSDGALGSRLQALRETASADWTSLGEIGVRPNDAPNVLEFGVHVDTADVIRIAWLEGSLHYYLRVAQFDGAGWSPLPGLSDTRAFHSDSPVPSLSVNRSPSLFAFAFAVDIGTTDSVVGVQQLTGAGLTEVGNSTSTTHPRVGHLSLAMAAESRATLAQSELDASGVYRLDVRRHVP